MRASERAIKNMSAASCLLTQDHFLCSICLDVFTEPVSTPCGHNFCKSCITEPLNNDVPFHCPLCQKMFYPTPELQVNSLIAEMVDVFRRSAQGGGSEHQAAIPREAHGDVCSGNNSKTTLVFCLVCVFFIFSHMNQDAALSAGTAGNILEVIQDIRLKMEEVRLSVQLSEDSEGELEQKVAEVMKKEIPKVLIREELMRVQRYAVDVTFDPDTSYPQLILSDDRKQVRCCHSKWKLSDNPKGFTYSPVYVLGKQRISSGKFYFEIQVKGKTDWTLGVAKESMNRKGDVHRCPQSGYWTIWMRNKDEYRALAGPPVRLSLRSRPEKVGVFVDYEEGVVLFYDVDAAALIHSFTGCFFTERLLPFFDPGRNDDGENFAPLIITSVSPT
ncbi:E3 ubiquitin-protein ligase TRIM21-like isoform X1 [Odontesthes bonariensis]|uniref:E3 ubiquitin-protein ligase TRIM21-like isoform X1 n=2 Tax=Odontesthes bonariensis TaxID=219752 RepID=UPI003F58DCDF